MAKTVRSATLAGTKEIKIREFPYPEVPKDAMVVKIEMCGICGTDVHAYEGYNFGAPFDFPILLGHETVGRVHEIGEVAAKEMEVRGKPLKEGDRVVWFPGMYCGKCFYCRMAPQNLNLCRGISYYGWTNASRPENKPWIFGGYGQYVYIRPGTWVYKVKEGVSTEAVAMLDTMASIKGVEMAMTPYPNIREGFGFMDTAVVQGAGSVGLCAVAKLKQSGAERVILVGRHKMRLKLAKEFGVDEIIDMDELPDAKARVKEVLDLTNGLGGDAVFDCAGAVDAVVEGLEMTRAGGTFVEIGTFVDTGPIPINISQLVTIKNVRILGEGYAPPQQYDKDLKFIEMQSFPFEKLVTHKFNFEDAKEAIETHIKRQSVKVALTS